MQTIISSAFAGCINEYDEEIPKVFREILQYSKNGDLMNLTKLLDQLSGSTHEHLPPVASVINIRNRFGYSPLHITALGGYEECTKLLISRGAIPDVGDVRNHTPLFLALKNHYFECAKVLLDSGANPDGLPNCVSTPLFQMCFEGCLEGTKILLEHGAKPYSVENHLLFPYTYNTSRKAATQSVEIAIVYEHYDCLKLLLKYGADPNYAYPEYPLYLYHLAVAHKSSPVLYKLLYEVGTDLHRKGPVQKFVWEDMEEIDIKNLLMKYSDIPRTLKSSCRLYLLKSYGKKLMSIAETVDLPLELRHYLHFDDIVLIS